jgi:hypothetical protein
MLAAAQEEIDQVTNYFEERRARDAGISMAASLCIRN